MFNLFRSRQSRQLDRLREDQEKILKAVETLGALLETAVFAKYPLLVKKDGVVMTEDGKATVAELDARTAAGWGVMGLAVHYGTTYEHVEQALAYARGE